MRTEYLCLLATVAVVSCGGSRSTLPIAAAPEPVTVPAGVDSFVAVFADSLAGESFVEVARQEEAATQREHARTLVDRSDSLWQAFEAEAASPPTEVTSADSLAASEAAATGGEALLELDRLLRGGDEDATALAAGTAVLLDSAQRALETAYRLNPFDNRNAMWLSRVYELQARRLGQAEAYRLAITELDKLSRLTPDDHGVFAMLANNHYHLGNWELAADHYQRAGDVYLATYDLVVDTVPVLDSGLVYSYARAQAEMRVRVLDAALAVDAYGLALAYARTESDSTWVTGELEWMAWDDMNIASSLARDSLAALEAEGDMAGARRGYLGLLATLTAAKAVDEVDWRLAVVDYNLGDAESAAARLQRLVQRTPVDSSGAPLDASYQRYLDNYGAVCLNLGRTLLHDEGDNRTALKYFEQSTRVEWDGRATAYVETAALLRRNVPAALEHATNALAREDELDAGQRRTLYRLMMDLYRRSGDFDRARNFRDRYRSLPRPQEG